LIPIAHCSKIQFFAQKIWNIKFLLIQFWFKILDFLKLFMMNYLPTLAQKFNYGFFGQKLEPSE